MAGKRFGRLVGARISAIDSRKQARWIFRCDCGNELEALGTSVRKGVTRSCGCLRGECNRNRLQTHGMRDSDEYAAWCGMKARCYNKKNPRFEHYGARGITVCDEWRDSFDAFYRDMGLRPSPELSIERKNNDLGYSKGNCIWGTDTEQGRNTRRVVMSIELAREARAVRAAGGNITAWARVRGVSQSAAQCAATERTWRE